MLLFDSVAWVGAIGLGSDDDGRRQAAGSSGLSTRRRRTVAGGGGFAEDSPAHAKIHKLSKIEDFVVHYSGDVYCC
jgi:hypothetical protein